MTSDALYVIEVPGRMSREQIAELKEYARESFACNGLEVPVIVILTEGATLKALPFLAKSAGASIPAPPKDLSW